MSLFFRMFQHLLPDSIAFRIRDRDIPWTIGDGSSIGGPGLLIGSTAAGRHIDRFFGGLAGSMQSAREYVDDVFLDVFPQTTRSPELFEQQFGISEASNGPDRIANIEAEWQAMGGQSPYYLQTTVRTAGFDVYIHEWWSSGPPWAARDPRIYTNAAVTGSMCAGEALAQAGESFALANNFLANETDYLVNDTLKQNAPPAVPDDPSAWPYFLYWGAAVFPNRATIDATRRDEFERLILKLCPTHQWIVTLVDYA